MGVSSHSKDKSSKTAGTGCALFFFGCFFAAGLAFFFGMINSLVVPEIRANNSFVEHTCKVIAKRIGESEDSESGTTYRPEILIEYTLDGRHHQIWTYDATRSYTSGRKDKEDILNYFTVGGEYPCWYDPDNHGQAVLVRGYHWFAYLFLFIPLLFMLIGGGGCYFFWTRRNLSPEQLALTRAGGKSGKCLTHRGVEYPTVPDRDLSDNPGSTLRYRVPLGLGPGLKFLGLLAATLFWNGIVSIFAVFAVSSHVHGQPEWCLTTFLIPFVLIGLFLLGASGRQLLVFVGSSPALVEIDSHPLCPGQPTSILIRQTGPMRLHQIKAMLICEETVSYTEGTTTRNETKKVDRTVIAFAKQVTIQSGEPWEHRSKLTLPSDVMHTFVSSNNKVEWKLILEGDVVNWPSFSWEYPIVVRPPTYAKGDTA